ncbi:MAG: nucleotidyltransferase family protein [Conexivisphaerales archaeon]
MQAVILAGGLGTRLRPYTFFAPKPMLPLGDRPLMEHIIAQLSKTGIEDIIITVSYLRKTIENYFGEGDDMGVHIQYVRTAKPMGTAGQLKTVEPLVKGSFVVLYGDSLVEADIGKMIEFHEQKKAMATLMLMPFRETMKYGFIETDGEDRMTNWREKPVVEGWINVGCYIMEPSFLKYIPSNVMYGMNDAFNAAVKKGERVFAFKAEGDFIDIGDKQTYLSANEKFVERLGRIL